MMRDGRHRILCPRIGRNRELSGDCCSSSRDHWFEIAQLSVSTLACLMHCFTSLIIFLTKQDGVQQLQPLKLSPTRPYYDDFNFEELLSDLTMIARMIHPHLRSRLVSARLTFGMHCCTLSRKERYGRRTNPVKSTCTSTTPQLSERAGADACLSTLHSKIDPLQLAAKGMLRARRLYCWRGETAFSGIFRSRTL